MAVRRSDRQAFTMLELVIVLTILTVLAGLVMTILPNLMARAHYATAADTITELNKNWMRSQALNLRYPDVYDSLLASDDLSTAPDYLVDGLRDQISPDDLTPEQVEALAAIGVRQVVDGVAGAEGTYDYAPFGTASRSLETTPTVMVLDLAAHEAEGNALNLKRHLVRASDGTFEDHRDDVTYVVFGVGENCSGVGTGKLIQEAPVHFGGEDELNPATAYQRFLVVFSIVEHDHGGETEFRAHFETAAGNDHHGPAGAGDHTGHFHEATAEEG